MAFRAERDQVFELVGAFAQNPPIFIAELAERDLVVHIMLARAFRHSAHLAAEAIPGAHTLADFGPLRAVIVGGIRPQAVFGQVLHRFIGNRDPVAGGLQIAGRQVERFLPDVFAAEPHPFAEAGHLRGDLQFAVSLLAAGDGRVFQQSRQADAWSP